MKYSSNNIMSMLGENLRLPGFSLLVFPYFNSLIISCWYNHSISWMEWCPVNWLLVAIKN